MRLALYRQCGTNRKEARRQMVLETSQLDTGNWLCERRVEVHMTIYGRLPRERSLSRVYTVSGNLVFVVVMGPVGIFIAS